MATLREVDVLGVFRYSEGDYRKAIDVISHGKIRGLEKLVTHVFQGLKGVEGAMQTLSKGVDALGKGVVKVVVMGGEEDWGEGCLREGVWKGV